jgi:hypothetical protein
MQVRALARSATRNHYAEMEGPIRIVSESRWRPRQAVER